MTGAVMNKMHRTHLVKELIESLPCGSGCIYTAGGDWYVSTEWLVGAISGRGFREAELEDALARMCSYFDQHVGHDSLVGRAVTKSGWPDLERVRAYCEQDEEGRDDR
jgi:hypothetical protein